MGRITVDVWDARSTAVLQHELRDGEQEHSLVLAPVPGATAIEIAMRDGDSPVLLAEVDAHDGQPVQLRIIRNGSDWHAEAGSRLVWRLAPRNPRERKAILPSRSNGPIDLVLLIDGTSRAYVQEKDTRVWKPLLSRPPRPGWQEIATKLDDFAGQFAVTGGNPRVAVLAFGDSAVAGLSDPALQPAYVLYPNPPHPSFQTYSKGSVLARLIELPASSGADLVDAVADGLYACARLSWRNSARKVLALYGDSPGYSVLNPPSDPLADAQLRNKDVDSAADELFRLGIEVVTILHHTPDGVFAKHATDLLLYTEEQYRCIATTPECALTGPFDPAVAAGRLLSRTDAIGRGAWPGILASGGDEIS
jgi:hypothetical protein